jgi:16S rRNA (uracil1498-N3)-methyltransferase
VELELGEEVAASPVMPLTLILSVFKFDRMEWAIEKCTELGASRIIPAIAARTEKHLAATADKRTERWRRIALQASEQSRRAAPPEISLPVKLSEAIRLPAPFRVVLAENEQQLSLQEALEDRPAGDLLLGFGPEGGWTEAESILFQKSGWKAASLGQTILRAETAAIAATAIAMALG